MLRQRGDHIRNKSAQAIHSHHCVFHYCTARSLERELRLLFSLKPASTPRTMLSILWMVSKPSLTVFVSSPAMKSFPGPYGSLKVHKGLIQCDSSRGSSFPVGSDYTLMEFLCTAGKNDLCLLAVLQ